MTAVIVILLILIFIVVSLNLVITVMSKYELEEVINGINYLIKGNKNGTGNS